MATSPHSSFIKRKVPLIKAGYLCKKGGERHNWNKRWFELRNHSLAYYVTRKAPLPKGEIPLSNVFIEDVEHKTRSFTFTINGCNRTFILSAETEESKHLWMKQILKCSNILQNGLPPSNKFSPSVYSCTTSPSRHCQMLRKTVRPLVPAPYPKEEEDTLFPSNYEDLSKEQLIHILKNIEVEYKKMREDLHTCTSANSGEENQN